MMIRNYDKYVRLEKILNNKRIFSLCPLVKYQDVDHQSQTQLFKWIRYDLLWIRYAIYFSIREEGVTNFNGLFLGIVLLTWLILSHIVIWSMHNLDEIDMFSQLNQNQCSVLNSVKETEQHRIQPHIFNQEKLKIDTKSSIWIT